MATSLSRMTKAQAELVFKEHNDSEVAKQFGITRQAVYHIRKKFSISSSRRLILPRNKKIMDLHRDGVAPGKIATIAGISMSYVYQIIKKEFYAGRVNSPEQNSQRP